MNTRVVHVEDRQRYEIRVDGTTAGYLRADVDDDVVDLPHTIVFGAYEGMGLASTLVRGVLDDLRARDKRVVATCPVVAHFVEKHPEYADLLA